MAENESHSASWIARAKELELVRDGFEPIRYVHLLERSERGEFMHWKGWFINDKGRLNEFWGEPEAVDDLLVTALEDEEALRVLNKREEDEIGRAHV